MDNNLGTSLILIHSPIGMQLFLSIVNQIKYKAVELEDVVKENPSLLYASPQKRERADVLNMIKNKRFNELWTLFPVNTPTVLPIWKKALRKIKRIIHL